jgi:hypothetical protein
VLALITSRVLPKPCTQLPVTGERTVLPSMTFSCATRAMMYAPEACENVSGPLKVTWVPSTMVATVTASVFSASQTEYRPPCSRWDVAES